MEFYNGKLKKIEFKILTSIEYKIRKGFGIGNYAVHKEGKKYNVTELSSGCSVFRFVAQTEAIVCIRYLHATLKEVKALDIYSSGFTKEQKETIKLIVNKIQYDANVLSDYTCYGGLKCSTITN